MAGGGLYTSYNDSKTYHQTILGDYDNNVIVPKSILIDTADAIRLKRDGSKAIEIDDASDEYHNCGIQPVDFATEISNLQTGGMDLSTLITKATRLTQWSDTTIPPRFKWKGDFRKCLYSFVTFHNNGYNTYIIIVSPKQVYQAIADNQTNVSALQFSGWANGMSTPSVGIGTWTVPLSYFTASFNGSDDTIYTATLGGSFGSNYRGLNNGFAAYDL